MTLEELNEQLNREQKISEYYYLALADLDKGHSIKELYNAMKLYESEEEFEACAGIKIAIKHYINDNRTNQKNSNKKDRD